MSKKKMPRSAMTLKDFHGGSIPSDLPLPSAPGMTVDRSAYERQGSGAWISPTLGRGYGSGDRSSGYHRQGSANGVRTFEDKASYFPNPANIGRNYDEDERKPVDGRPRSSHSADHYEDHGYEERRSGYEKSVDRFSLDDQGSYNSGAATFTEPRSLGSASDRFPPVIPGRAYESDNYVHDEYGLISVGDPPFRAPKRDVQVPPTSTAQLRQQAVSGYPSELVQPVSPLLSHDQSTYSQASLSYTTQQSHLSSPPRHWRQSSQQQPSAAAVRSSGPNVWTARRDDEFNRPVQNDPCGGSQWRSQNTSARISEVTAAEKVSSGRWQSEPVRMGAIPDRQGLASGPEILEPVRQNNYGTGYQLDTSGRGAFSSDTVLSPYANVPRRGPVPSDVGRGGYVSEWGQDTFTDSGRTGYGDSGRAGCGENTRGVYPEGGRSGFTASGKIPNSDSSRDREEIKRVGYTEAGGRGNCADSGRSFLSDTGRVGHSDDRLGGNGGGFNETVRTGNSERIAFTEVGRAAPRETGRVGGESGQAVGFTETGRRGYGDSEKVDYNEAGKGGVYADSNRGSYSEFGRGGYSNTRRGTYSDRGHISYTGDHGGHPEGVQGVLYSTDGVYGDSGRTYGAEGGLNGYGSGSGRVSLSSESGTHSPYLHEGGPRGGYMVDGNWSSYGGDRERSRNIHAGESGQSLTPDGARSESRGSYPSAAASPGDASWVAAPMGWPEPVAERPRLKLLPRSKPVEKEPVGSVAGEAAAPEEIVREIRYQADDRRPAEVLSSEAIITECNGESDTVSTEASAHIDAEEETSRLAERPKLLLKPRSQPAEAGVELDGSEKVRQSLFGGARPRELVLKDRGADESAIAGVELNLTPPATSGPPPVSASSKPERQEGARMDQSESWADEKQEISRRFERQGSWSLDRQGPPLLERQDSNRVVADRVAFDNRRGDLERKDARRSDRGDFDRQDNRDRYENNRPYDRQESRNCDSDKQDGPRRDIDKQDSWRRPASPSPASGPPQGPPATSALLDPSPRMPGRFGYSATASAVELAQAFSRSSTISSLLSGVTRSSSGNLRGPVSPVPRSPGQVYGPGSMNGSMGVYGSKDAPFSRLAEAPPRDVYISGGGYGNDRPNNGFSVGNKAGGYGSGSGDMNRVASFGRSELASGPGNDDFPGKRGLPLRRAYE